MKIHTKFNMKVVAVSAFIIFLFTCEAIEAQTPAGAAHMHRATRRRTAVVVSSATHANDQQQAQAAAAAQTPPPAQAAPAPAPAPATVTTPSPASTEALLPIGTVVTKLPSGCASTPVGGQEYYHCGANYYVAAFQEGTLVYVTTATPQ